MTAIFMKNLLMDKSLKLIQKDLIVLLQTLDAQVAVVSVKVMVCDFCARGIEKTFQKDKSVKKIDVDLSKGKVLVAFDKNAAINFEDIKKKILANGQNAIGIQVLSI